MWTGIKDFIFAHIIQSVVVSVVIVAGILGISYYSIQKSDSKNSVKEFSESSEEIKNTNSCAGLVNISNIIVEKDPAGDPEAWIRFDYTTSATRNCQYTIKFYDNQEQVIRTIPNIEDTFQSPSGQIHNGYSSTPFQVGMTASVTAQ